MRKKHSFFVSAMALALTIALSFSAVHFSFVSYADDENGQEVVVKQPPAEEQGAKPETPKPEPPAQDTPKPETPKDTPDTPPSSTLVPITPTTTKQEESSTKAGITIPNPFTTSSTTAADPTTAATANPGTSEKEPTAAVSEKPSEKEQDSSKNDSTSTTKSGGGNKSTTKSKKYTTSYYNPAPATTVRKMTVPHVDNTEISGSTLSPMDAYFERISGDTSTEPFSIYVEETELATTEPEKRNLSTTAIVAICLVAIGVVVCLLTLLFALRNKRAAGDRVVEYDDEYEDVDVGGAGSAESGYDGGASDMSSATQVDQSSQFTVVSLDDKDYKD